MAILANEELIRRISIIERRIEEINRPEVVVVGEAAAGVYGLEDDAGLEAEPAVDGNIQLYSSDDTVSIVSGVNDIDFTIDVAPGDAHYLTLALDGDLDNERVFIAGDGCTGVDGGAGGNYTLNVDDPHARQHVITAAADHTVVGAAMDVVGLTGVNTLGVLTPSSDPGAASAILKSDASGRLHLVELHVDTIRDEAGGDITILPAGGDVILDGDLQFVGAQTIRTTADSLTLAPAADLNLTPGGTERVRATAGVRLQSDNYVSQVTGWGISYAGSGDFRYLYADELHAKAFIADLEQALAGGQIICKSVAPLAATFTVPAPEGNTALTVESFKGFPTFRVFVDADIVRLRQFDRAGSSLSISDCWGQVWWVVTDEENKTQTYSFTRSAAPNAGAAATDSTIAAGTLVLDYGLTGNGFLESNAIDGAMAEYAPYHQIVSWAGHPHTGKTVRTRLGNLRGIFNVVDEYGLYAGAGVTDADKFLRISNEAVEGHNLPIKLYDGASTTVFLDPDVPSIALGATVPTGYATNDGIWMGKHGAGDYRFRVGDADGERVQWDDTDGLRIFDHDNKVAIQLDTEGNAYLSALFLGDRGIFSVADGQLLLGPGCERTAISWKSLRGQRATISGAFQTMRGAFPETQGVVIEPGTTNHVINPSFVLWNGGPTSWTADSTPTPTDETTITRYDGHALRFVADAPAAAEGYWQDVAGLTPTVTYKVSVWAYGIAGTCRFVAFDGGGWANSVTSSTAQNGRWQRLTVDKVCPAGGSIRIYLSNWMVGNHEMIFDGVQLEATTLTTVCIGSMAWCDWSDGDHASTSVRVGTTVSIPTAGTINVGLGSLEIWLRGNDEWNPNAGFVFSAGNVDARFDCYILGTTVYWRINGAARIEFADLSVNQDHHLVFEWNGAADRSQLFVDGILEEVGTCGGGGWAAGTTLYLGSSPFHGTDYNLCGTVTEIATFTDYELTAAEVAAIWNLRRPMIDHGAVDSPGIYIVDGKFRISSAYTGSRVEITADEIATYNLANKINEIDSDGISILVTTSAADLRSLQFRDGADGTVVSRVAGFESATVNSIEMRCNEVADHSSSGFIRVESPGGQIAQAYLDAYQGVGDQAAVVAKVDAGAVATVRLSIDGATRLEAKAAGIDITGALAVTGGITASTTIAATGALSGASAAIAGAITAGTTITATGDIQADEFKTGAPRWRLGAGLANQPPSITHKVEIWIDGASWWLAAYPNH